MSCRGSTLSGVTLLLHGQWSHAKRPWPGWAAPWLVHLFGAPTQTKSKKLRDMQVHGLMWPPFDYTNNKQLTLVAMVEGMLATRQCWGGACAYIQSVWAHWYAVHRHTAVSNRYTHTTTWLRVWGSCSGSLVESTWCHYVMVEADSYLKLHPASSLSIYKMFEHIDMLSMGIGRQP